MKTYRSRHSPMWMQLAQVCLAWVSLVIPSGMIILNDQRPGALAVDRPGGPTAEEIYWAVGDAEARAIAVRLTADKNKGSGDD